MQRRAARRKRAAARLRYHQFRTGQIHLCHRDLLKVRSVLDKHHSRDPSFILKIDQYIMASTGGWHCQCGHTNAKKNVYCGKCGWHWEEAVYYPGTWEGGRQTTQKPQTPKAAAQEPNWEWPKEKKKKRRPKSPRDRSQKPADGGKKSPFSDDGASGFPPWPALGKSPFQMPDTMSGASSSATPQNVELLQALKQAYSGPNVTIPQEVKDLIEKTEKDNSRGVLRNLHQATNELGKAQRVLKEAQGARRSHRAQWMKHLTESSAAWEKQLGHFREKDAKLREATAKARQELTQARQAIQELNSKAVGGTVVELPEEVKEESDPKMDEELAKMQEQLQTNLRACAFAVGVAAGKAICIDDDISDLEDVQETLKRPCVESKISSGEL